MHAERWVVDVSYKYWVAVVLNLSGDNDPLGTSVIYFDEVNEKGVRMWTSLMGSFSESDDTRKKQALV